MSAPTQTLAELSRAVAEKRPCEYAKRSNGCWARLCPGWAHSVTMGESADLFVEIDFTDPARLFELEGELLQAGINIYLVRGNNAYYMCRAGDRTFTEPGTAEGRTRLILRAWILDKSALTDVRSTE